jgi:DNA (cytosine-5)-methyltransferase 1
MERNYSEASQASYEPQSQPTLNDTFQPVSNPTPSMLLPDIKGIDLFAGAGGFSLGALQSGVDIVGALELNEKAAKTYSSNIRRADGQLVPLINGDILPIDPMRAMELWNIKSGECDLIMGGPPCQGFSSHRINDSGVDDPRNKLLCRYFEYVAAIRPRFFLVENVPGMLWPRHAEYLKQFYSMGSKAQYDIKPPIVLNACDYGVMQSRRRVFILGIDRNRPIDIQWPPEQTHVPPTTPEDRRNGKPVWKTSAEAFRPALLGDPNNVHMNHSATLIELFQNTPPNGGSRRQSGRVLKCHQGHSGHNDVYGRIDPSKPAPTMTTACINPSKGRFVHPEEHHGITLRQAARIQTFPENFIFHGGLMASGAQIGNAVPVELAKVIIQQIVNALTLEKNGL